MMLIDDGFSNRFDFQEKAWGEVKFGFTHFQENDVGLAKITPCLENRKSVVFRGLINGIGAGTTELHIFHPICENSVASDYLLWFIKNERFISGCIEAFSGAVGQQRVGKGFITDTIFPLPPFAEQKRIVSAIESAFAVIDDIERNKADLRTAVTTAKSKILSLAVRGKLVPQDPNDEPASVLLECIRKERESLVKQGKIKRRKAENAITRGGDNCYYTWLPESWEVCCLDDVLVYEQPTAYIVKKTNYNDSYQTPVLTAGKSFIIGYTNETEGICDNLPVIIFDDFTTDSRYVDFKFKVKSSAMKILRNNIADIKYLFYFMQTIESNHTTHKRYWISDYSQKFVALPPLAEQRRIVVAIETAFEQFDSIATILA
jgi:type I restriction enzyme S subunit